MNKLYLLVLVPSTSQSISDDKIRSKNANESYRNNYDSIFGKKVAVGQA